VRRPINAEVRITLRRFGSRTDAEGRPTRTMRTTAWFEVWVEAPPDYPTVYVSPRFRWHGRNRETLLAQDARLRAEFHVARARRALAVGLDPATPEGIVHDAEIDAFIVPA
jgi:hypothetical protein